MSAEPFLPSTLTLPSLRAAAAGCRGCHLYEVGTQTVFGEGRASADVMLVGEQPGDQEDVAGRPFVGPAGRLLDRALEAAGISRDDVYVTNAVKHFKWTPSPNGKRRIHQKPDTREVGACKPWLEAEIAVLRPRLVVALGATAAQTLLGKSFKVTQHRGEVFDLPPSSRITATIHPSAILRSPGEETRAVEFDKLVADLRVAAAELQP
ncbi:MAG TPA: UdgX family uracil-DNA binding protein [Frankiaceae bacterium]|nr:UdgX family uracil-DNA binding protein [Frankiaceae bacterium]